MDRDFAFVVVLNVLLVSSCIFTAESETVTIQVSNPKDEPIEHVIIATKADGSVSAGTDTAGRTHVVLPPGTQPGDPLFLVLVKASPRNLRFLSPWQGRATVPKPGGVIEIVLSVPGDKTALANPKIVSSITGAINELNKSAMLGEEPASSRKRALETIAKESGFKPTQIDDTVRAFLRGTDDPNRRALADTYFTAYPTPFGQSAKGGQEDGFWARLNPFARYSYVEWKISELRTKVNELDEITASNVKMIKDVDARWQEGLAFVSAKTYEANQHSIEVGDQAQVARQTAAKARTGLNSVEGMLDKGQYETIDQTELGFHPHQPLMNARDNVALDAMTGPLRDQSGYFIEVQGFCSGRGKTQLESSQQVADAVARHLVINDKIPLYRIYRLGLGDNFGSVSPGGEAEPTCTAKIEIRQRKDAR